MGKTDPRIDNYIAGSAEFAKPILTYLRHTIHEACPDVEETTKWGFPHFTYKGILCSMASFKSHCAFGFWKQNLLFGKKGSDKKDGAMGQFGRITGITDLPTKEVLTRYVRRAMKLNEEGVKVPRIRPAAKNNLKIPSYITAALRKNSKAMEAFSSFSPSHKREYVEWITEAKREETRTRRLKTAIAWMSEGKVQNWRYAKK
jgi:uncharacterized protein YdeI (YjbR/CyaY-like superfamily)